MKFTNAFKKKVLNLLQTSKDHFYSESMGIFNASKNTPADIYFYTFLSIDYPQMMDYELASQIIRNSCVKLKNPTLMNGDLNFEAIGRVELDWEQAEDYNEKYSAIIVNALSYFLEQAEVEIRYKQIASFDCFHDVIMEKTEVEAYLRKCQYQPFNSKDWLVYFQALISEFYPQFLLDKEHSTKDTLRYAKEMENGLYYGFELDMKEVKYEFKRGIVSSPEMSLFVADEKNEEIWTIQENLDHPFFGIPNLSSWYAKNVLEKLGPNHYGTKNRPIQMQLPNGKVRVYNSDEFGETLKQYAFFEAAMNAPIFKSYMQYIEAALTQI